MFFALKPPAAERKKTTWGHDKVAPPQVLVWSQYLLKVVSEQVSPPVPVGIGTPPLMAMASPSVMGDQRISPVLFDAPDASATQAIDPRKQTKSIESLERMEHHVLSWLWNENDINKVRLPLLAKRHCVCVSSYSQSWFDPSKHCNGLCRMTSRTNHLFSPLWEA